MVSLTLFRFSCSRRSQAWLQEEFRRVVAVGWGRDDSQGEMPLASTIVESLVPCLPRSTKLLPAHAPPRGLHNAPLKGYIGQLQADDSIVSFERPFSKGVHHSVPDPLVASASQCGCRTRLVGYPPVGAAEHQPCSSFSKTTLSGTPERWQPNGRSTSRTGRSSENRSQMGSMRYGGRADTSFLLLCQKVWRLPDWFSSSCPTPARVHPSPVGAASKERDRRVSGRRHCCRRCTHVAYLVGDCHVCHAAADGEVMAAPVVAGRLFHVRSALIVRPRPYYWHRYAVGLLLY